MKSINGLVGLVLHRHVGFPFAFAAASPVYLFSRIGNAAFTNARALARVSQLLRSPLSWLAIFAKITATTCDPPQTAVLLNVRAIRPVGQQRGWPGGWIPPPPPSPPFCLGTTLFGPAPVLPFSRVHRNPGMSFGIVE